MKHIIVGTDRLGSNSKKIADFVRELYREVGEEVDMIELEKVAKGFAPGPQYGGKIVDPTLKEAVEKIESSDGLIVVVPEYNGSMPGVLKYFIDHLKYPDAFEYRPICFIGIGGMFGGLRPVEHLQQVFGYRNAFIFPERIFLMNVYNQLKKTEANPEGKITDPLTLTLMRQQVREFRRFVEALKGAALHPSTRPKAAVTAPVAPVKPATPSKS